MKISRSSLLILCSLLPIIGIINHTNIKSMRINKGPENYIDSVVIEKKNSIKETANNQVRIKEERQEVYDNLTLEELGDKIERNLNSTLKGYGHTFANYAIELGVDPYLALGIVLHETGCKYNCSYLTKTCNNIGGQKGSGCGAYAYFNTMEEGIYAFLNNLSKNYYLYGLNNTSTIGPKYAEDPEWSIKVNRHIENIKKG